MAGLSAVIVTSEAFVIYTALGMFFTFNGHCFLLRNLSFTQAIIETFGVMMLFSI
jgi:hypothetical protein